MRPLSEMSPNSASSSTLSSSTMNPSQVRMTTFGYQQQQQQQQFQRMDRAQYPPNAGPSGSYNATNFIYNR